jgi:hypothetical protein
MCGRPGDCHDCIVDQYDRYAVDSRTLAAIGEALAGLPAEAKVQLPRYLAVAALAARERNETDDLAAIETEEQEMLRDHAATLALIGLAMQENADFTRDPVTVRLTPDLVANALRAGNA